MQCLRSKYKSIDLAIMEFGDKALFVGHSKRGMEGMLMKTLEVVLYELEGQESG